jgi:hypothetical protein
LTFSKRDIFFFNFAKPKKNKTKQNQKKQTNKKTKTKKAKFQKIINFTMNFKNWQEAL